MITKKTRLMSAILAIMMLVTLFTSIVMPVSAAGDDYELPTAPSNLIAYKNRKTSTDRAGDNGLINYAITDLKDWQLLAEDTNYTTKGTFGSKKRRNFEGWAFWLTDDIDFTGVGEKITNEKVTNTDTLYSSGLASLFLNIYYKSSNDDRFAGQIYGQGHKIKNLKIDATIQITNGNYSHLGLIASGYGAMVRDLTVDKSCSFKYAVGGMTKEWQTGVFCGNGTNMTYINCTNEASLELSDLVTNSSAGTTNSGSTLSISAFGRNTGADAVMINCGNVGTLKNNDVGRASGLAEWLSSGATLYNCFNAGTLTTAYTGDNDYTGLVSTSLKDEDGVFAADFKNCYNLGDSFADGSRNFAVINAMGTAIEDAKVVSSGELAYMMNTNYEENEYGRAYFTMVDGAPRAGFKKSATVKVVISLDGAEDHVLYANADQSNVNIAHPEATNQATYSLVNSSYGTISGTALTLKEAAVGAADLIVKIKTADRPNTSKLEAKLAEIAKYGAEFYLDDENEPLDPAIVDEIRDRVANGDYTSSSEVKEDLDLLESYKLAILSEENLELVELIHQLLKLGSITGDDEDALLQDAEDALALAEEAESAIEAKEANLALQKVIADFEEIDWEVVGAVPFKAYENPLFAEVTEWAITDEADWRFAVEKVGTENSKGMTLTLTNDIDMAADGDNSPVRPLAHYTATTVYFNGTLDGNGHVFKNLYVEETALDHNYNTGLVARLGAEGIVKNLGIASGEVKVNWGVVNIDAGSNALGIGAIVGQMSGGGQIIKCWNAATVIVNPVDLIVTDEILAKAAELGTLDAEGNPVMEDDVSIGGIVGRGLSNSIIDGCYNVGKVVANGFLHLSGLNDWGQATGKVYNSYDASELISDTAYGQAIRYNTTAPSSAITANVYAVGHRFSRLSTAYKANTIQNSNLLPEVVASGELAYLLNANATDQGNGKIYYKVENGMTVHAKTASERTFRITLEDDEGNILYTYANGGTSLTIGGQTFTVTADKTVSVEDASHQHDTVVFSNFFEGKDYVWSHQVRCQYSVTIDGVTAYCDRADESQSACTRTFKYVEDSADETHAHTAIEYCTVCLEERERSHVATAVSAAVTQNADCLKPEITTYTCSECGVLYSEETKTALGHLEVYTAKGDGANHIITCGRTGCTLSLEEACTPDDNGWTETIAPGEDNFGEKQATCDRCQGTIVVQLPKLAITKGEIVLSADEKTAEVTVSLKNNVAVKDLTLTVGYDQTAMTLTGVNAEEYGFTANIVSDVNGTAIIALTAAAEVTDAQKAIAKLTFTMATKNGALNIPSKGYEIHLSAESETASYAESVSEFTITLGFADVAGDFYRDGQLDTRDAMLLMRYVANTLPPEYENVITEDSADLDTVYNYVDLGDGTDTGRINTYDVIHLLRILNGWG